MIAVGLRTIKFGERLYQPLLNTMLYMAALVYALEAKNGPRPNISRVLPNDVHSDIGELKISLPADAVMQSALEGTRVGQFDIFLTASNLVPSLFQPAAVMPGFIDNMASAQFLLYYHTADTWLTDNGRPRSKDRTDLQEFLRVIRNAVAHGGSLDIRNAAAPVVKWRSLSYGPADNEKPIIGAEIFFPDLLALMIEADDELVSLGAPR